MLLLLLLPGFNRATTEAEPKIIIMRENGNHICKREEDKVGKKRTGGKQEHGKVMAELWTHKWVESKGEIGRWQRVARNHRFLNNCDLLG